MDRIVTLQAAQEAHRGRRRADRDKEYLRDLIQEAQALLPNVLHKAQQHPDTRTATKAIEGIVSTLEAYSELLNQAQR